MRRLGGYPAPMLILASASPRRRHLLGTTGLRFEVVPAEIDETPVAGEGPETLCERLAREKAVHVARTRGAGVFVLGSDTLVTIDGEILGKPRDPAHAEVLLGRLMGRTHRVVTGIAVASDGARSLRSRTVESRVTLRAAGVDEIRDYVAGGEPLDKAGAYALQGEGGRFVTAVAGSETNVIGLPLEETLALLRESGFGLGGSGRP